MIAFALASVFREGARPKAARPFLLLAFGLLAGFAPPGNAPAEAGPDLATDCGPVRQRARDLELASDPYWATLLHHRAGWFGQRGLVDDPGFYLSPDGKYDLAAELDATVSALCRGAPEAACRFPARAAWLRERLPDAGFPAVACPDLDAALDRIDPHGATLVFPAAHPNGPASMFGHTLVRIDPAGDAPLLGYGVNFAAQTDPDDLAVTYVVKGLFGGYPGYYGILPYYDKVEEYSDIEQRDLWEYRLDLTPAEARRLTLHAWELKDTWSRYYYFDENCSYNVLFLLEAARPGVRLTDAYPLWVSPPDTVFQVWDAGLVDRVVFRPSLARKIRHRGRALDDGQAALARRMAAGEAPPSAADAVADPRARAAALDVAADLVQVAYVGKALDEATYRRRFLSLLAARSRVRGGDDPDPVPEPEPPHRGHRTARAGLAAGSDRRGGFADLSFRPAHHGLRDPDAGYVPGSEIAFADFTARVHPEEGAVAIERADLLRIASLSPRDRFFRPTSWGVRFGSERRPGPAGGRDLVALGSGLVGLTGGDEDGTLGYAAVYGEAAAAPALRRGVDVGLGGLLGGQAVLARGWKVGGQVRGYGYLWTGGPPPVAVSAWQTVRVTGQSAVELSVRR